MIDGGNQFVILVVAEAARVGSHIITIVDTDGGMKIGNPLIEIFQIDDDGLIAKKRDTIPPVSEESYDFY